MREIRRRRYIKGFSSLIIAASLLVAGCNNAEEAVQEVRETPVAVGEVTTGALSGSNEMIGEAKPGADLLIVPKMSGQLKEVLVKKGDHVEKGQVLARIDDSEPQRALKLEQAALKQAESGLERARNGLVQAEGSYKQALASHKQAESGKQEAVEGREHSISNLKIELENVKSQWDAAKLNLERMDALFEDGLISKVEHEEAVNAESRAANAHEQIKLNLAQAESEAGLGSIHASVEQASIGVDMAKATKKDAQIAVNDAQIAVDRAKLGVEAAKERLDDYTIYAPASGEIVSIEASAGEMVGQSAFARMITVDVIHATVQTTAEHLLLFEIGDELRVQFAGLAEEKIGTVAFISPTSNEAGLFTVEVEVNNEARDIRPGMVATLIIEEVLVDDSMIIPTAAVVERQDETYVFIVENGQAVRKEIEVIRYDTELTAITGDVSEGDQIVIKGQNLLSDGDVVKVIEEEK